MAYIDTEISTIKKSDIDLAESKENIPSDDPLSIHTQINIVEDTGIDFTKHKFISGESWVNTVNLQAQIVFKNHKFITCECLIDKENKVFETRDFPKHLFDHFDQIEIKMPVLISIRSKPGSIRINVHKGYGLVDQSLFDIKEGWDSLKDLKMDTQITFEDD